MITTRIRDFRRWIGGVIAATDFAQLCRIEKESRILCAQVEGLEEREVAAARQVEEFRAKHAKLYDDLSRERGMMAALQAQLAKEQAAHIETLKAAADKFSMLATRSPVFGQLIKPEMAPGQEGDSEPIQPQRKMGRQVLQEWATEQAKRRYGIAEVTSSA